MIRQPKDTRHNNAQLSVRVLFIIMLSGVMLDVVMPSVMAPAYLEFQIFNKNLFDNKGP